MPSSLRDLLKGELRRGTFRRVMETVFGGAGSELTPRGFLDFIENSSLLGCRGVLNSATPRTSSVSRESELLKTPSLS